MYMGHDSKGILVFNLKYGLRQAQKSGEVKLVNVITTLPS
jgi:hypothetical protein